MLVPLGVCEQFFVLFQLHSIPYEYDFLTTERTEKKKHKEKKKEKKEKKQRREKAYLGWRKGAPTFCFLTLTLLYPHST